LKREGGTFDGDQGTSGLGETKKKLPMIVVMGGVNNRSQGETGRHSIGIAPAGN